MTVLNGVSAVRTISTATPAATYSAADQTSDFGALPASFSFTVAQVSPLYGAGHAATATFVA